MQAHYLGRALLVIARSTPQYMLAYLLLQLMGPSMLPAISALALHNGAIAPLAGRRTSLNFGRMHRRDGISTYETTPRLYDQFMAYMLYRWEVILRASAIFGILGVRTLGYNWMQQFPSCGSTLRSFCS